MFEGDVVERGVIWNQIKRPLDL